MQGPGGENALCYTRAPIHRVGENPCDQKPYTQADGFLSFSVLPT